MHAPTPALDATDDSRLEFFRDHRRVLFRDDDGHADAHVEDLKHLRVIHAATALDVLENRGHFPTRSLDHGVAIFREDAREIVHEAAAGDVREALDQG